MSHQTGSRMRIWLLAVAVAAGIALLFGGVPGLGRRGRQAVKYRTAAVERGDVLSTASATGTLNAVTTVQVGSQLSGIVWRLHADFNARVRQGQLLAELDPATFRASVAQARADVQAAQAAVRSARSEIGSLEAGLHAARAEVATAQARVKKAQATLLERGQVQDRMRELARRNLSSQQDLDTALANRAVAAADLEASRSEAEQAKTRVQTALAQRTVGEARVDSALAQVAQRQAALELAEINLARTRISSPIDGVVVSRNVDVGQTVAASLQAPTLFVIANDLRRMQIDANVDEADIGRVKDGQPVEFTVDAYPENRFRARVVQVRLQPIVSQNVVTYDTVVEVANDQLLLRPGMTANVYIQVAHARGVLKVPNAALAFRPAARGDRPGAGPSRPGVRTVHRLVRWQPEPVEIRIGISDGSSTHVVDGTLAEGDLVVTGVEGDQPQERGQGPTNPFAPRRR